MEVAFAGSGPTARLNAKENALITSRRHAAPLIGLLCAVLLFSGAGAMSAQAQTRSVDYDVLLMTVERFLESSGGAVPLRAVDNDGNGLFESGQLGLLSTLLAGGEPVTAVVCSNDRLAAGAYHAFKRHGLRLPDDISVVGFDDPAIQRGA